MTDVLLYVKKFLVTWWPELMQILHLILIVFTSEKGTMLWTKKNPLKNTHSEDTWLILCLYFIYIYHYIHNLKINIKLCWTRNDHKSFLFMNIPWEMYISIEAHMKNNIICMRWKLNSSEQSQVGKISMS